MQWCRGAVHVSFARLKYIKHGFFLLYARNIYTKILYKYSVQLLRSEHTSHAVVSSGYRGRHAHLPLLAKQGAFLLAHSL